jgi:diguanylate cyclase (GGDEF)-like protein
MIIEIQLFEALVEMIPFGVYVVDIKTYQLVYANHSYKQAHGDCVHSICYDAIYKEDSSCYYCKIGQLIDEQGNPNGKTLIFERFNEYNERWYQHHEKALCWSDGRIVKYTIEVDISESKAMQNQLAEAHALLAIKNKELMEINRHDELTKVFNRSHLNHVLAEQIYNMERYHSLFSVVLLDIDDFKKINDNYGHLVGDAVLIEMAQLVSNNIRQFDCFGRWGGEEFMIITPHVKSEAETKYFVEKLCNIIANHDFSIVGHCSCSLGVTHCSSTDTMISVVKNADDALYFAKANGKNQVVVYDELNKKY